MGHVLSTYGHFTAMQVRGGAVRGLDRHFRRLDEANREIFGAPVDPDDARRAIRDVLGDRADASVRVYVVEGVLSARVGPPNQPSTAPQRLRSVPYVRPFAHLKHLGGFAQSFHAELARRAGYDDALLTDGGVVSESSIANVGFVDADGTVVWPEPPWLHGIAMQLIEAGLPTVRRKVTLDDLADYRGAFLTNSIGVTPVAAIDAVAFAPLDLGVVQAAVESAGWDRI